MYDINANRWTQITDDTAAMGGPSLIFDHQGGDQKIMMIIITRRKLENLDEVSGANHEDEKRDDYHYDHYDHYHHYHCEL